MAGGILHRREGRVGHVTIDRAPLNVLDIGCFEAMKRALSELTAGDGVDVVVISSTGEKAFSAGADVGDHLPDKAPKMLDAFHSLARALWSLDAVSVAAVKGLALGGGMELALCCDIVVASEDATFSQPEIKVGSFPPIATALLPRTLGHQAAADIVLTGRRLSAAEGRSLGFVSRVVPAERLDEEVASVVAGLTDSSASVMRKALRALRRDQATQWSHALAETERIYVEELLSLEDAREGIEAFMQKRKPVWKSR